MPGDSRCPELDALQRLADNQASPAEALQLHKHLVHCVMCAGMVRSLKEASQVLSTAPVPSMGQAASRVANAPAPAPPPPAEPSGEPTAAHVATPAMDADEFLSPPQSPDEIGRLGPYRVLKLLGSGGMGMVFLAEDSQLQRKVALKAMRPNLSLDEASRHRFLQEARSAAATDHDHIVTIYQVGEDRGIPYLAMQYLPGQTLEEKLFEAKILPIPEVLRIGREVAEGLASAHERGLMHRDIKPSNIWLESSRGNRVKILDFGLARLTGDSSPHLTRTGFVVGTAGYLAPEQARGQATDSRCDLFSLGCVLYEMCTGVPPFQGRDTMARLTSLAIDQPVSPRQHNPLVPSSLAQFILHLLEKNPENRPPSAAVVAQTLAAIEKEPREEKALAPSKRPLPAHARAHAPSGWANSWLAPLALAWILIFLLAAFLYRVFAH